MNSGTQQYLFFQRELEKCEQENEEQFNTALRRYKDTKNQVKRWSQQASKLLDNNIDPFRRSESREDFTVREPGRTNFFPPPPPPPPPFPFEPQPHTLHNLSSFYTRPRRMRVPSLSTIGDRSSINRNSHPL